MLWFLVLVKNKDNLLMKYFKGMRRDGWRYFLWGSK
jgi:hypothetical protein